MQVLACFLRPVDVLFPHKSFLPATFVCFSTGVGRTSLFENDIIHNVKRKENAPQEYGVWLPAGEQKEDIMNKVSAFFKNCWSNYVDFMGKYGEYTNRF